MSSSTSQFAEAPAGVSSAKEPGVPTPKNDKQFFNPLSIASYGEDPVAYAAGLDGGRGLAGVRG